MNTYTVLEYEEQTGGTGYRENSRRIVKAASAAAALEGERPPAYSHWRLTVRDENSAFIEHPESSDSWTRVLEAEIAEEPAPEYGALREAIARATIAEHLLEAAIGELARIADVDQDQAYVGLLTLSEWTPGEAVTDELCREFLAAAQEERQR